MLDFSVDITEDATQVTRAKVEALREHGFDDRAILQITLIASWFNYINRVADALGVGREDASGVTLPVPAEAAWAEPRAEPMELPGVRPPGAPLPLGVKS